MYHTFYKTVNTLTGQFYYGVHSTENPDDSYLGSGSRLLNSVKKHGRENFEKTVLAIFFTSDAAYDHEQQVVTEELIADPLCLNLELGGRLAKGRKRSKKVAKKLGTPGGPMKGKRHSQTTRELLSSIRKKKMWITDGVRSKHVHIDSQIPSGWYRGRPSQLDETRKKRSESMTGIPKSESAKRNMKKSWTKERRDNHAPTKGRIWVNNGIHNKMLPKGTEIPNGYTKGRLISVSTRH